MKYYSVNHHWLASFAPQSFGLEHWRINCGDRVVVSASEILNQLGFNSLAQFESQALDNADLFLF